MPAPTRHSSDISSTTTTTCNGRQNRCADSSTVTHSANKVKSKQCVCGVVVMRCCSRAAELRRGVSGYACTNQTLQRHQLDHHDHLQWVARIDMPIPAHSYSCGKVNTKSLLVWPCGGAGVLQSSGQVYLGMPAPTRHFSDISSTTTTTCIGLPGSIYRFRRTRILRKSEHQIIVREAVRWCRSTAELLSLIHI